MSSRNWGPPTGNVKTKWTGGHLAQMGTHQALNKDTHPHTHEYERDDMINAAIFVKLTNMLLASQGNWFVVGIRTCSRILQIFHLMKICLQNTKLVKFIPSQILSFSYDGRGSVETSICLTWCTLKFYWAQANLKDILALCSHRRDLRKHILLFEHSKKEIIHLHPM